MRSNNYQGGGLNLNAGMQGIEEAYTEKPRPSLYNVIRKLKEANGPMFHRLCFITRINEHEIKNVESDYSTWMNNIVNNDEDGDLVPGHNDEALQYGGIAIILGPWIIHLLEAEEALMTRF